MILINLLPHREAARKKRKEAFMASSLLAALLGGGMAFLVSLWYQHGIEVQQTRNAFLEQENKKLDDQIKDIASLRAEIQSLKARQQAVENLQSDRNTPVHLLSDLVTLIPDGIYLTSVKQEKQSVTVTGMAQSQERVSELLRNLATGSEWMNRPELIEIIAASQSVSNREQRRVFSFNVKVQLVKPESKNAGQGAPAGVS
ncbi:MAG TPA: PilN domain-containing protein [Burkholderiaceae bacterium]|nr:PilN domain-containing protein [Burkholderiaceae bacterium]